MNDESASAPAAIPNFQHRMALPRLTRLLGHCNPVVDQWQSLWSRQPLSRCQCASAPTVQALTVRTLVTEAEETEFVSSIRSSRKEYRPKRIILVRHGESMVCALHRDRVLFQRTRHADCCRALLGKRR